MELKKKIIDLKEYMCDYQRRYRLKNGDKIRARERIRDRKRRERGKNKQDGEYHKEYMKKYSKREEVKHKQNVRRMTYYYYGKVPKGYHRHHLDYDSPHNFILIPIKKHGEIHRID